jgi:hypothetical protein
MIFTIGGEPGLPGPEVMGFDGFSLFLFLGVDPLKFTIIARLK